MKSVGHLWRDLQRSNRYWVVDGVSDVSIFAHWFRGPRKTLTSYGPEGPKGEEVLMNQGV